MLYIYKVNMYILIIYTVIIENMLVQICLQYV